MPLSSWSSNQANNTGILAGLTLDGAVMTVPQIDNAFRDMAAQIAAQVGKVNFKGADMPSASTVNLANATGWYLDITGFAPIASLGIVDAGQLFMLRFAGALTLTYNASSFILPGAADITTAADDIGFMMSMGSGNWRCVGYQRATGAAVNSTLIPIGTIVDYGGTSAPSLGLLGFGQAVSRTTYAALFAVYGTTYGSGDGSTTFNVPDFRGRVVAGQDDMGGTSANRLTAAGSGLDGDVLGGAGGAETHTLTVAQLASHRHGSAGLTAYGGGLVMADATGMTNRDTSATTKVTTDVGSDQAHNNVQPTIIMNKIIYAGV